jgi:hypothetical protein
MRMQERKETQKVLPQMNNSLCPRCGIAFHCGAKAGNNKCWCFGEEPIKRDENAKDCLCKECLNKPINPWLGWGIWTGVLVFCAISWSVAILLLVKLFH